jgi:hypothetical protein
VEARKIRCEVEHYTVHTHFYGNARAKFPQNAYQTGKRSGFYTVVSITVDRSARQVDFDDS